MCPWQGSCYVQHTTSATHQKRCPARCGAVSVAGAGYRLHTLASQAAGCGYASSGRGRGEPDEKGVAMIVLGIVLLVLGLLLPIQLLFTLGIVLVVLGVVLEVLGTVGHPVLGRRRWY